MKNYKNMTTKKGDSGKTQLLNQDYVDKSDSMVDFLGEYDNFLAQLGIVRTYPELEAHHNEDLRNIITISFEVMGVVGSYGTYTCDNNIEEYVERKFNHYAEIANIVLAEQKDWVVYGDSKNRVSAELYKATTMSRMVEHKLYKTKYKPDDKIKIFFNRLSKILYLLARIYE